MRQSPRLCGLALAVAVLASGAATTASAQTVDELLARNFQSRGGLDKLKAVNSMKMTGKMLQGPEEVSMTLWLKRPSFMRQEIQRGSQKIVQAFDGDRAWTINPFAGSDTPREPPAAQVAQMKSEADFDGPLVDYKAKGHTIELVGVETFDGAKVYKLELTRKDGQSQFVYLDADTCVERKMSGEVEQGGQTIKIETLLSDYRSVSGILVPFLVRRLVNGRIQSEITVESVEINLAVDDGLFRMPAR